MIHQELGIAMGVTAESIAQAIDEHPRARAIFLINPTYYGITSDIHSIVKLAHDKRIPVLVDEAHGAHMYFHHDCPATAMQAGADMSAASIHKTAGSLTQSSILLEKSRYISSDQVKQVLNLTLTSSASYLLMCSLDVARRQLAVSGNELLDNALQLAREAREEINEIDGLYAFGRELTVLPGCDGFDETKLAVNVRGLGYTGYQVERILRKEYNIQIELADLYNIMAIVSIGDRQENLQALVEALKDMAAKSKCQGIKNLTIIPHCPELIVSPRDAFYSRKKSLPLERCTGEIAGEMIMAYPPGIPVICMGERITSDIVDYIRLLKEEDCELQGTADPRVNYIKVLGRNS
jgi:arginine decarboxylase